MPIPRSHIGLFLGEERRCVLLSGPGIMLIANFPSGLPNTALSGAALAYLIPETTESFGEILAVGT